jgi:flagellar L-ring protein FlgH
LLNPVQNPVQQAMYQPVSLPQPAPIPNIRNPNSLWQPGSRSFFKDLRAHDVGDLLTVVVSIKDAAKIDNTTTRSRANKEKSGVTGLFGLESMAAQVLPGAPDPGSLVGLDNTTNNKGTGAIDRTEEIDVKVAATVVQKLPNGNLVIQGRQEIRVNNEVRELLLGGIVRPQDILADNTITSDKIAEARISYGGRGQITDVQQPRYGQQVLDIILPF